MNYRHGYHAGNFADVIKHIALIAILTHLKKKDAPFAVIDSHAGRGAYDLSGEQASKTGEAANGIARLRGLAPPLPASLAAYIECVGQGAAYPGSPLIAAGNGFVLSKSELASFRQDRGSTAAKNSRQCRL